MVKTKVVVSRRTDKEDEEESVVKIMAEKKADEK